MPGRAALFGSILAGLTLTAISQAAVPEKDCLAAPDGKQVQGARWYYRSDPATKRHCWYVRGEGQEVSQLASSSMKPASPPRGTALRRSVVDARAEIPPTPEIVQPKNFGGLSTVVAANVASSYFAAGGPSGLNTQTRSLLNARAGGAPSNMVAGRHRPQPASAKRVGPPAPRSVWMLLSALAGALALVGVTTAVIARVGRGIAIRRRNKRVRSRRNWSAPPSENTSSPVRASSPPVRPRDEAPMDWVRTAREAQETNRQSEQIEELLSRVSRRSAV